MATAAENALNFFSSPQLWGQAAAPLISGSAGLIGSALQYKYNKRLMKLQNKYNVDMWKMQADYNSPQSQMQRFQEAGLNPNLIYGQGSNGNMSQAPEQGVPEAPNFTPGMQKLAEAFNIENLRTIIANRKKAEAEADNARTDADRNYDMYEGDKAVGALYDYDYKSGQFVPLDFTNMTRTVYRYPAQRFYKLKRINDIYRSSALIAPRALLLKDQHNYLQPQIVMSNFEARHQPTTYWIGQGTKILGSLPLPKLNWSFGGPRTLINNHRSDNRSYDYKQNITNY